MRVDPAGGGIVRVESVDSAGGRAVPGIRKRAAHDRGCELLAGPSRAVREVLPGVGFDLVADTRPDVPRTVAVSAES